MMKSPTTQPSSLSQPSSSLWGKQIHMFSLDMSHRKFANTPKDKYQDKLALIRSMQKHRSEIIKGSLG